MIVNLPVLVLNQNYEPLNICRVRRAVPLVYRGKAEMLENGLGYIHTSSDDFAIPSVIKLQEIIKRPRPQRRLTRDEIFDRDNHTCQYCGKPITPLTLDHVKPRYQGGEHSWENVVTACGRCNRHKAGRTPEQARMKLLSIPKRPNCNLPFRIPRKYLDEMSSWHKYLPVKRR